jgi:hypothetical protein
MAPIVQRYDAAAILRQRADPLRVDPIGRNVGRETMNEENRVAVPLIQIRDPDAVGIETVHSLTYRIPSRATMLEPTFFKHRRLEHHG